MKNLYEAWVMFDDLGNVITDEAYQTPEEVIEEMDLTWEEVKKYGFSVCKVLIEDGCWIECIEEIEN